MLSLHQELLLLAINDQGDIEFTAGTSTFRLAFVGACIVTLAQSNHIECDLDEVRVIDQSTPLDATLALVLAKISEPSTPQRLRYWLSELQEDFQDLIKLTLQSLCDQGVLTMEESRFLWMLSSRKYPIADGKEKKEAKLRILAVLLGEDIPRCRGFGAHWFGKGRRTARGLPDDLRDRKPRDPHRASEQS